MLTYLFLRNNKYSLAFFIQGGPEGEKTFESSWRHKWNPMIWSHKGYACLIIKPHKVLDKVLNSKTLLEAIMVGFINI
jgi:hypothetical protein